MKSNYQILKNNKLKFISIIIIAVILICCIVVGFLSVNAETEELKESYVVGETVYIPDKKIDGVEAQKKIIFPSGTIMNTDSIVLNEEGKYTIEYYIKSNSTVKKENVSFFAYNKIYSFSGTKSTASYGQDTSIYNTDKVALNVSLAEGETLTFNKIINLNDYKGEDFVNFYATPKTKGIAEVQGIYFYLTDIYDETNKVTFQFKNVAYNGSSYVYTASYVTAGHGSESPRAWAYDSSTREWKLRVNDKFGIGAYMSLYGMAEKYNGFATKDSYCGFGLDLDTKKAFVYEPKALCSEIIDLDNPSQFDNLWKGFTTGEVRLSIEAYDYTGSTFNLNITKVAGYDFYDEDLIIDNVAPKINIDNEGYDLSNLVDGSIGNYYKVFNATAFDKVCGKCDVTTKVYYGFNSTSMINLSVKDGKVLTQNVGKYKIEYTAKDLYGNIATENVFFSVNGTPTEINLEFTSSYATSCKVGESLQLPTYSLDGGAGDITFDITTSKKAKIDKENMTFIPLEVGKLNVIYTAIDMTGYKNAISYEVNVVANPLPVILNNLVVPDYLFGGLKYQFQSVNAFDFNTQKEVTTDVYVDGVKCDNNLYTPEDKDGADLQDDYTVNVEYKVNSDTIYSKDITILDVKKGIKTVKNYDISGYWLAENFTKTLTSSSIDFETSSAINQSEVIKYAKSILADSFSLGLNLFNIKKADKVSILLNDIENVNNKLIISLVNDRTSKKTLLYVNGEKTPYSIGLGGFYDESQFNISISNGYIVDSSNVNYKISDIFNAEKVNISVIIDGIEIGEQSKISITQICGNSISSSIVKDQIPPIVKTLGEYDEFAVKGDNITIYPVIAEDILDTYISYKVSVYLEKYNGQVETLINNEDASISHQVKVSDYGKIKIVYKISDGANQTRKPEYILRVVNLVSPVITVDESLIKDQYKVNEEITFPVANVTDDLDTNLEVKYFIISTTLVPKLITDGKFTPTKAGNYTLRIYTIDSFSNITIKDIYFKVVD